MKENNNGKKSKFQAPGTLVLVFIFFAFFVVLYTANWILLSGAWGVR